VRNRGGKDFLAGVLYVLLGAGAIVAARQNTLGTAASMGPGYFPIMLGVLLLIIGVFVTVRGIYRGSQPVGRVAIRPILLVLSAVCFFALTIERLGLASAVFGVVVVGYLANPRWRLIELGLLAVLLTAACIGIFVYGLNLPFNVWPFAV
jgi:hypothetical protein